MYILRPPAICRLLRKPMRPKYYPIRLRRYLSPKLWDQSDEEAEPRHTRGSVSKAGQLTAKSQCRRDRAPPEPALRSYLHSGQPLSGKGCGKSTARSPSVYSTGPHELVDSLSPVFVGLYQLTSGWLAGTGVTSRFFSGQLRDFCSFQQSVRF